MGETRGETTRMGRIRERGATQMGRRDEGDHANRETTRWGDNDEGTTWDNDVGTTMTDDDEGGDEGGRR
jgi:hypothetical protein